MNKMKRILLSVATLIAISGCTTVSMQKEVVYLSAEEALLNANTFLNDRELTKSVEGLNNLHIVNCNRDERYSCEYMSILMKDNEIYTMSSKSSHGYIQEMSNKKIQNIEHKLSSYDTGTEIMAVVGDGKHTFKFDSGISNEKAEYSSQGLQVFINKVSFEEMQKINQLDKLYSHPSLLNQTSILNLAQKEDKAFTVDKEKAVLVYWN
jgi:hypothetical protein